MATSNNQPETTKVAGRLTPLPQAREATAIARNAFAAGDQVTGIAATVHAAQLVELAKIWGHTE